MTGWVIPTKWYWFVGDQSPGTQVWQSETGQFVALANADYVAFLAAVGIGGSANAPSSIDTAANLFADITNWNAQNSLSQFVNSNSVAVVDVTNDVTLTLPLAPLQVINTAGVNKSIT